MQVDRQAHHAGGAVQNGYQRPQSVSGRTLTPCVHWLLCGESSVARDEWRAGHPRNAERSPGIPGFLAVQDRIGAYAAGLHAARILHRRLRACLPIPRSPIE
jgi:hypothetical protein